MTDQTSERLERLILGLLRAKRKTKHHDLELTAELNTLQRDLEET